MAEIAISKRRTALWDRQFDFWLLGGASILLFIVMSLGNGLRNQVPLFEEKFMMAIPFFGLMSIFFNQPHFVLSYELAYSRGFKFIFKHWFTTLFVPLALIAIFIFAYVNFESSSEDFKFVAWLRNTFDISPDTLEGKLGPIVLGLSIWIMYVTVGWHYVKQTYGCMMVYDRYDNYGLTRKQKAFIRYGLFSLAAYQFFYIVHFAGGRSGNDWTSDSRFPGIKILVPHLPDFLLMTFRCLALALFICVLAVFVTKFVKQKALPSLTFLAPWVGMYIWWVPMLDIPEYYILAVPFFHSMQYLPFAFRMQNQKMPRGSYRPLVISLKLILLVALSFSIFEMAPYFMDQKIESGFYGSGAFFATAIVVFINVHHFFLDSVVWKFDQPEVRAGIL